MDHAGTAIYVKSIDLLAKQAPADPIRGFENPNSTIAALAGIGNRQSRGEPGRARAHHRYFPFGRFGTLIFNRMRVRWVAMHCASLTACSN